MIDKEIAKRHAKFEKLRSEGLDPDDSRREQLDALLEGFEPSLVTGRCRCKACRIYRDRHPTRN